jgi:hypothetical protein
VQALGVADGAEPDPLCARLGEAMAIPVQAFDPLAGVEYPRVAPNQRGGFAGAVGLLHGLAHGQLPVNLAVPKEPRPPRDPSQRRAVLAAGAAVLALLVAVGWGFAEVAKRERELKALNLDKIDLDGQMIQVEEDAKRIKALGEWADGEVVWLDELYDLADRFPDGTTSQLTNLTGQPLPRTGKEKYVARLSLKGITTVDSRAVDSLIARLVQDQYYRVDPKVLSRNMSTDRFRFPQQFTTQVDVARRPPDRYVRRLPDFGRPAIRARRGDEEPDFGLGDFGLGGDQ